MLDEFFRTGVYTPRSREDTLATSSPSMDISKASNLERFVFELLGAKEFSRRWPELEATGSLDLSDQQARLESEFGFVSASSTHEERLTAIRLVHTLTGRLIDPHTADGVSVALALMEPGFPTLVLETAKAAKFGATVAKALGGEQAVDESVQALLDAPQRVTELDNDLDALRSLIEEHALRA